MIWRSPAAWLGLLTLLVPIAIHLLVRQQAEARTFPSLRFIPAARLASVRRRLISDWPLLIVRLATLALAVGALADPLWLSASRREAWSARTARALVVDASVSARAAGDWRPFAEGAAAGAFQSATFEAARLADGLRRAVDWLESTPPARREIVCLSDFQLGAIEASMLREVPPDVGVRFVRIGRAPLTRTADGRPRTYRSAGSTVEFGLRAPHAIVSPAETAVSWRDAGRASAIDVVPHSASDAARAGRADGVGGAADVLIEPFKLRLRGGAADRPWLLAAADAVLTRGVSVARGNDDSTRATQPQATQPQTTTIVVMDRTSVTASTDLPADAARLSAPWMADVVQRVATDSTLAGAMSRVATAAQSSTPPSSSSPWIAVMRDAAGKPALLAASHATNGGLLLVSHAPAASDATLLLVRAVTNALAGADPFDEAEVLTLADATLAQWQRPAAAPSPREWHRVETQDRRWLWAAVLVMLAVEQIVRRRARSRDARTTRPRLPHESSSSDEQQGPHGPYEPPPPGRPQSPDGSYGHAA